MDDEKRFTVEFPFGDGYVAVHEPTEGQLMVLSLLKSTDPAVSLIRRSLGFIEHCMDPDAWEGIVDRLMSGELDPRELFKLFEAICSFKWGEARDKAEEQATPIPAPNPFLSQNAAPRTPRVISNG